MQPERSCHYANPFDLDRTDGATSFFFVFISTVQRGVRHWADVISNFKIKKRYSHA